MYNLVELWLFEPIQNCHSSQWHNSSLALRFLISGGNSSIHPVLIVVLGVDEIVKYGRSEGAYGHAANHDVPEAVLVLGTDNAVEVHHAQKCPCQEVDADV